MPDVALTGSYARLEERLRRTAGARRRDVAYFARLSGAGRAIGARRCAVRKSVSATVGAGATSASTPAATAAVRANADRNYAERLDEIAQRDPETGKRRQIKEEAGMIFAPPPHEEKRGLLSSLLRRDDDKATGPAAWRAATPGEMRQARKEGGRAFKRGLFG